MTNFANREDANMSLWRLWEAVPDNAIKPITAGRLKGMSDINPMWRYRVLTETFGPAGVGWKTENETFQIATGADGVTVVICTLRLFVLDPDSGEWSNGIFGVGGSNFVANEKNGLYTSDEAYKMAHTDAISVACKQLGIGANVYWSGNTGSKYPTRNTQTDDDPLGKVPVPVCAQCGTAISVKVHDYSVKTYKKPLCMDCQKREGK